MRKQIVVLLAILIATTALTACRKREQVPAAAPTTEEQALRERQEQEAARRAEETTALEARLSAATAAINGMRDALGREQNPAELEASIQELDGRLASPRQLLAELRDAQGDAWPGIRARLAEALDALEAEVQTAAAAVAEWGQREEAAREARRDMKIPLVAKSGLIEGLDGGDYEPYLASVVERVQRRLRAEGLYAGAADGFFDVTTRAAVGRFQEREGLAVSGVPSPMTRARLFAD